jgi:hypothetical protein
MRGSTCIAPSSLREIDGTCRSVPRDRYVLCMRNVLQVKVDILTFIQEHSGDFIHNMVNKLGVRERGDAKEVSHIEHGVGQR